MEYILLDYRFSFNNELYEHPDIKLNKKDSFLFLAEKEHLINKGFKIISSKDSYGSIIAVDNPKYYKPININNRIVNIFNIKPLKIDFTIWKCGRNGLICECCNDYCIDYFSCKDSYYFVLKREKQLKEKFEKELIEAKKKYIESLPEDNIIKLLFYSN